MTGVQTCALPISPGNLKVGFIYNRELNVVDTYVEDEIAPPTPAEKVDRLLNIVDLTKEDFKAVLGIPAPEAKSG